MALFIAVSIYCYLINFKSKQKYLLRYYITNRKLKKFCINSILQKSRVIMIERS